MATETEIPKRPGSVVASWLPSDLAAAVKGEARAEQRSQSNLIRLVLSEFIEARPKAR